MLTKVYQHELYHLDLAADSPEPNPRVLDLTIDIRTSRTEITTIKAYGPLGTKILARYQGGGAGVGSTGYYVQRNADNLAYYALAKYVMSQNDNVYPHLPVVTYKIDGPPYPDTLAIFVSEGSDFYMNTTTDDLAVWDSSPGGDYPGCSDNENESELDSPLAIDGFAPASAYPDDYNSQVSAWISFVDVVVHLFSRRAVQS